MREVSLFSRRRGGTRRLLQWRQVTALRHAKSSCRESGFVNFDPEGGNAWLESHGGLPSRVGSSHAQLTVVSRHG